MSRYFFDFVSKHGCKYDYSGRVCPTLENAYRLAELIALDYAVDAEDAWTGSTVNVRSPEGRQFFSITVQPSGLAVA
jgi:hypothetical protein